MVDHLIIPIEGIGTEIGDTVLISQYKLEVIGREGTIHDPALGHQVFVSEGERTGIADGSKALNGCIVVAFICGNHDPPCRCQVVYRQLD